MPATAKVITLQGDPRKPESAEHIIIFPGGSISVCRTSNNEYWAHIQVNKGQIIDDTIEASSAGLIIDSRLDYTAGGDIDEIPNMESLQHIAIRIRTDPV